MNFLYLHGFASSFNPSSDKITNLSTISPVHGFDIDYTHDPEEIIDKILEEFYEASIDQDVSAIVGCSLGGFYAAVFGSKYGIPFIAMNPSLDPYTSLYKYKGNGVDYAGNDYYLSGSTIEKYSEIMFPTEGAGLILLDRGDDVLDSNLTHKTLKDTFAVKVFEEGSHRFEHTKEAIDDIEFFIANCYLHS